jgi:hypothetical protein
MPFHPYQCGESVARRSEAVTEAAKPLNDVLAIAVRSRARRNGIPMVSVICPLPFIKPLKDGIDR